MRIALALAALLLLPAGAHAAEAPFGDYKCVQTLANYGPTGMPSYYVSDRGDLTFNENGSYDYDAFFLEQEARAGGWDWDGEKAGFSSGPLFRPSEGWQVEAVPAVAARMPHDPVPGRTWPLVVRSLSQGPAEQAPATVGTEGEGGYQQSYWYCGTPGVLVRQAVGPKLSSYLAREAGVRVRLPRWMPLGLYNRVRPKVVELRKGVYRLGMAAQGSYEAIFSAKRAPASDLGHRRKVSLGKGVTGWVGNYGCAYNGDDPDWGPKYCGRIAIVWHQAGVNYCIEVVGNFTEGDLVRAARQAAR